MNEIKEYTEKLFEDIKHIDENGNEYWLGRELQQVLVYKEWRKFNNVINKAIIACNNSKMMIGEHFVQVDKTINNRKRRILILLFSYLFIGGNYEEKN